MARLRCPSERAVGELSLAAGEVLSCDWISSQPIPHRRNQQFGSCVDAGCLALARAADAKRHVRAKSLFFACTHAAARPNASGWLASIVRSGLPC